MNLTDTVPISATRLMDVAREIVLQLGEWAHHPALAVTAYNQIGERPHIAINLVGVKVAYGDQSAFLDQLAIVLDTVVHISPDWHGDVSRRDYRATGVTVTGGGLIDRVQS